MPQSFNLTSLIVLLSILAFGLIFIWVCSKVEDRRQKKIMENRFPSATRKYPKEVDNKLDITERFYHN